MGVIDQTITDFADGIVAALPKIVSGIVFLALAAVVVRVVGIVVKAFLRRIFEDQPLYVTFCWTVVAVFLWFGVILGFLSIVGLNDIAAALGTASGFLALGVSYALSGMIADAVAGIYLLRDPDFNPGDTVVAGDTTGVVQEIELRKTRIDVDGDTVVRANADIEKKWTKKDDSD